MNVYMDDIRHGPDNSGYYGGYFVDDWANWIIVRGIDNVKQLLELGIVDKLSLDHDMGGDQTGYDLTKWMAEHSCWPKGDIIIHSANPVGAENMKCTIDRYRC